MWGGLVHIHTSETGQGREAEIEGDHKRRFFDVFRPTWSATDNGNGGKYRSSPGSLRLPGNLALFALHGETTKPLPASLPPGDNCTMFVGCNTVIAELIKSGYSGRVALKAVVSDAVDKKYYSKKCLIDVPAKSLDD